MKKVIKEEKFEVTFRFPAIYSRLTFEDGTSYWITALGVKHEEFQEPLEKMYENKTSL